ncbi:MAG TPA: 3-phosphoshikimate 1-carboxyvinyltransferase [Ignavibacteria bacterium]|nr:3-phosphoshikimate 1-carboxyvinyltransferase [Ignavibacteria bacterium]
MTTKNKILHAAEIKGTITAPASKSIIQRFIAIAALTKGRSILHGYTPCNDSKAALQIAKDLGAEVLSDGNKVIINGNFKPVSRTLNCGESGLGLRMFAPIAALWNSPVTLTGEGSLKTRPVGMLEQPLSDMGIMIKTYNGTLPVEVCGPFKGGISILNGSISSQILTGLLIASPLAVSDTTILVRDLKSKPYIDMTIQIMADFGVEALHDEYETFTIKSGQRYSEREYTAEGDWSGASFLLVAGALGGSVTVENLSTDSKQADSAVLKVIEDAGAIVTVTRENVKVEKNELNAFEFDATESPDLFPPLVALAAHCNGVSGIKGVSRLKHKESDRATVLMNEFAELGTNIEIGDDTMFVYGGTFKGGKLNSNNDHRIAMAGAVASILSEEPVMIEDYGCVAKSYTDFFKDLEKISNPAVMV